MINLGKPPESRGKKRKVENRKEKVFKNQVISKGPIVLERETIKSTREVVTKEY